MPVRGFRLWALLVALLTCDGTAPADSSSHSSARSINIITPAPGRTYPLWSYVTFVATLDDEIPSHVSSLCISIDDGARTCTAPPMDHTALAEAQFPRLTNTPGRHTVAAWFQGGDGGDVVVGSMSRAEYFVGEPTSDVHFLHVSRNGGRSLKRWLGDCSANVYQQSEHISVRDLPAGSKVVAAVRSPDERFLASFWFAKQGGDRGELASSHPLRAFDTPSALLDALMSPQHPLHNVSKDVLATGPRCVR